MRRAWVVVFVLTVAAAGLRFYGLGAKSLWFDEGLSWRLQSLPVSVMIGRTGEATTVHPPLYFAGLRGWATAFGDSEVALRSFAAAAGVLAVPAAFLLVRGLFALGDPSEEARRRGTDAAVLTAALIALNPLQIHTSQQVRGYALAGLLFLTSGWLLTRALRASGAGFRDWLLYAASALAFCYTHYMGLFSVFAQGVFVFVSLWAPDLLRRPPSTAAGVDESVGRDIRAKRTGACAAAAVIVLGFGPWVPNLVSQSENLRTSWVRPTTAQDVADQISRGLATTWAVPKPFGPAAAWCGVAALGAVWGVLFFVRTPAAVYLALCGAVPVGLNLAYSATSDRSVFDARYLLFAQLAWIASFAFVFALPRGRTERIMLGGLPVFWSVSFVALHWDYVGAAHAPGMRAALRHVLENRTDDEPIFAQTPYVFFGASYYARDAAPVRLCVPEADRMRSHAESQLLDDDLITPAQIDALDVPAAWLVTSDSYLAGKSKPVALDCFADGSIWEAGEARTFAQDLYWERPVVVVRYRRTAPRADIR